MKIDTLISGLSFTECPRWHNNRLWFSDFYTNTVFSIDSAGNSRTELQLDDNPGGLGWAPNGDLRVISQVKKQLLGYDGKAIYSVADLSALAGGNCNDMVVADDGSAYIGNFGFDIFATHAQPTSATLIYVSPNGEVSAAAQSMQFPNGSVILDAEKPAAKTLVVAETMANRLTAFSINDDGSLSDRRIWADLSAEKNHSLSSAINSDVSPDGIASDPAGGIWVATVSNDLLKVMEGGEIAQRIVFDQTVIACAVAADGSLYVCTTAHLNPVDCIKHRSARIERVIF